MKKVLVLGLILVFGLIATNSFAALNEQDQDQSQTNRQKQGQGQAQAAIAAQGQLQGNLGIQRGNDVSTKVKVQGDTYESEAYAVSYPSLSGGEGVSQANAYSIFGGLGLSNTEQYKAIITQIQAIEASQSLHADFKAELVEGLVRDMVELNKDKRFLGLFWKTSGRNLSNLFGILSWDSFWKKHQHPFTKAR